MVYVPQGDFLFHGDRTLGLRALPIGEQSSILWLTWFSPIGDAPIIFPEIPKTSEWWSKRSVSPLPQLIKQLVGCFSQTWPPIPLHCIINHKKLCSSEISDLCIPHPALRTTFTYPRSVADQIMSVTPKCYHIWYHTQLHMVLFDQNHRSKISKNSARMSHFGAWKSVFTSAPPGQLANPTPNLTGFGLRLWGSPREIFSSITLKTSRAHTMWW